MQEGGWVEFHVSDVPFSMEYDVIIRYEPQVSPLIGVLHLQKWACRAFGAVISVCFLHAALRALEGGEGAGAAPQPCVCQQPMWEHHPGR